MELNQEYIIEVIFSYCKRPTHKGYQNIFNAECPVCREGKSAGRTRRLFYFPHKKYFYCHNCSKSWNPFEWVREVTGLTLSEIFKKNNEKQGSTICNSSTSKFFKKKETTSLIVPDMPDDCVDLTDSLQVEFYRENTFVNLAVKYCNDRRLFNSINSCGKFFISLADKVHKNRLLLPFYDNNNKVVCYQTRSLTADQQPKYLTKFGEKTIFGINNVISEIPYVFVFEGPIDSMFVKNGVAMASLSPTERQFQQLHNLFGHEQVYVFDNDKNNVHTTKKVEKYIREGKKIFIWPREFSKYKDFNEICCGLQINEIPWKFIINNSASGKEALIKQRLCRR